MYIIRIIHVTHTQTDRQTAKRERERERKERNIKTTEIKTEGRQRESLATYPQTYLSDWSHMHYGLIYYNSIKQARQPTNNQPNP